ncbi:MAG: AzlC family ABC transporter permease [Clostridiales bacterium]|nr:AzlC family ABC transporter permease [Clostridiales bacterium]MCF8023347.1 AzlC family ABC transporter permease [Clostridiales bacterium]
MNIQAYQDSRVLNEFISGISAALFFIIEFLPVGLLFGTLAIDAGLSAAETAGMSSLVFAGASQFLALNLLNTGAAAGTIILAVFVINLRHVLMSSFVASVIPRCGILQRTVTGALVTDEGFALTSQQSASKTIVSPWFILGINVSLYIQWQLATLSGIYLGNILPQLQNTGIEAILYALFLSIMVLSICKRTDIIIALLAASIAVILNLTGYGSSAVLASSLISSFIGLGVYMWIRKSGSS